jgi:hypothetical protein
MRIEKDNIDPNWEDDIDWQRDWQAIYGKFTTKLLKRTYRRMSTELANLYMSIDFDFVYASTQFTDLTFNELTEIVLITKAERLSWIEKELVKRSLGKSKRSFLPQENP